MKKRIRTATDDATVEFRKMKIGETVRFPFDAYNNNSLRSLPSSALANDRKQGKSWKTRTDFKEGCVFVTRTA